MGNKQAPDNFRNYVETKRATAEMKLLNNHDTFVRMWKDKDTLSHMSFVIGVSNDRLTEYAIRIGLKQRGLKKETKGLRNAHHPPRHDGPHKESDALLQTFKMNNTSRKWFMHSSACEWGQCKFLALPSTRRCHPHHGSEL